MNAASGARKIEKTPFPDKTSPLFSIQIKAQTSAIF